MRLSCPSLWLLVGNLLALIAKLCHNPPQKGRRIIQTAQDFNKLPVIKAGAGKMLDLLHI